MILECLLQDKSRLTLDCAKTSLGKGDHREIKDEFYSSAEIQNAIKMGLIRLVGDPPAMTSTVVGVEKSHPFRNTHKTRLAFECVRGGVSPGAIIQIPASKLQAEEIRQAVIFGMLEDIDHVIVKAPRPLADAAPLALEELTAKDIIEAPTKARPPVKKGGVKAKPISRAASDEGVEEGGEDESHLFAESRVIDPSDAAPKKKPKAMPVDEDVLAPKKARTPAQEEADRFSFLDIFGTEKTEGDDK